MEYVFIGWCKEDNHDKVWGIIKTYETPPDASQVRRHGNMNEAFAFWGRRGKKLQTKTMQYPSVGVYDHGGDWELEKLILSKLKKGYIEVDKSKLDQVYPEFQNDLEATAIWQTLKF